MYFQCGEGWGVTPAIVTSGFIFGVKLWEKGGRGGGGAGPSVHERV